MKRSAELAPLSRDHHHGLFAALKLTRCGEDDVAAAAAGLLEFWHREGRPRAGPGARRGAARRAARARAPAVGPHPRGGERPVRAVEETLPEDELAALGAAIDAAERDGG